MFELRIVELEETLKAERTRDLDRKHYLVTPNLFLQNVQGITGKIEGRVNFLQTYNYRIALENTFHVLPTNWFN